MGWARAGSVVPVHPALARPPPVQSARGAAIRPSHPVRSSIGRVRQQPRSLTGALRGVPAEVGVEETARWLRPGRKLPPQRNSRSACALARLDYRRGRCQLQPFAHQSSNQECQRRGISTEVTIRQDRRGETAQTVSIFIEGMRTMPGFSRGMPSLFMASGPRLTHSAQKSVVGAGEGATSRALGGPWQASGTEPRTEFANKSVIGWPVTQSCKRSFI